MQLFLLKWNLNTMFLHKGITTISSSFLAPIAVFYVIFLPEQINRALGFISLLMYTLPLVRLQNSPQCLLLNGLVGNTSPGEAQQRSKGLAALIPETGGRRCSKRLQKLCVCCPGNICGDHSALKCAYTWVLLPRRGSTRVSLMSELQVTDRVEWVRHSFNCRTSDNATAEKTSSKHHHHTAWPTTPLETLSGSKKFLKPLVGDTLKAALLSSATHIITTFPSTW